MRPGRCDVVVPVPALTSECAEEIFKRIYRTHPTYGQVRPLPGGHPP